MFLKILQNSQENTCARVSFLIKKKALAQVFSCEFCEISKNPSFTEHLRATASRGARFLSKLSIHLSYWITLKYEKTYFRDNAEAATKGVL